MQQDKVNNNVYQMQNMSEPTEISERPRNSQRGIGITYTVPGNSQNGEVSKRGFKNAHGGEIGKCHRNSLFIWISGFVIILLLMHVFHKYHENNIYGVWRSEKTYQGYKFLRIYDRIIISEFFQISEYKTVKKENGAITFFNHYGKPVMKFSKISTNHYISEFRDLGGRERIINYYRSSVNAHDRYINLDYRLVFGKWEIAEGVNHKGPKNITIKENGIYYENNSSVIYPIKFYGYQNEVFTIKGDYIGSIYIINDSCISLAFRDFQFFYKKVE